MSGQLRERGRKLAGSVAKLIVTLCYLQLVVLFTLEHFKIWDSPYTLRPIRHDSPCGKNGYDHYPA